MEMYGTQWQVWCERCCTPFSCMSNTGLMMMTMLTYQSTLLTPERAERSIGRWPSVRAFPYERPNFWLDNPPEWGWSCQDQKGFKSFSLVDAKVVNDLRTTRGAMAQLACSHIPEHQVIIWSLKDYFVYKYFWFGCWWLDLRCVVLVLLLKYVWIIDEWLFPRKDPRHPETIASWWWTQPEMILKVVGTWVGRSWGAR